MEHDWPHAKTTSDLEKLLISRPVNATTMAELHRFGDGLMAEVLARWAGLETKAQVALGFALGVLGLIVSQLLDLASKVSDWRAMVAALLVPVVLCAVIAVWFAASALLIRPVGGLTSRHWVCTELLPPDRANDLAAYHLVVQFAAYQELHKQAEQKALALRYAQLGLITSGAFLVLVIGVTTTLLWRSPTVQSDRASSRSATSALR